MNVLLAVSGICLLLGWLGFVFRKRWPRTAIFLCGVMILGPTIWMMASILLLWEQGEAWTFSRGLGTFDAASAPTAAKLSFAFHFGLGLFLLATSLLFLLYPFSQRAKRVRFADAPSGHLSTNTSWSIKGVLRLLIGGFALFIATLLWRRYVG
ncbi:MAG TPA: hypothetical protein VFE82_03550 [Ramlibacter sp.]|jgi:hypothetical protein|uniref:hypothetical protein n=1 Tax=Ramlibacter sp. TaxID=1917967 RepID=UPI002D4F1160|nr:hypothetical protein [Ramlibacter sp.]HZY17527.1 hypothetical protein [Ramlibacter sp.]